MDNGSQLQRLLGNWHNIDFYAPLCLEETDHVGWCSTKLSCCPADHDNCPYWKLLHSLSCHMSHFILADSDSPAETSNSEFSCNGSFYRIGSEKLYRASLIKFLPQCPYFVSHTYPSTLIKLSHKELCGSYKTVKKKMRLSWREELMNSINCK